MSFNKKGVLGEIIITFIATIIIIFILVIFALASAVLKATDKSKDFEGVKINHPEFESGVGNYMNNNFGNMASLRILLSGEENGETFSGGVERLNFGNTVEVMGNVKSLKDAESTVQVEKNDAKFYCQKTGCWAGTTEFFPGKFLEFYYSPFNVKITIAQPEGTKGGTWIPTR